MNVLVLGGSGFVGQNLVDGLVDAGHDVTVLSRHPDDEDLPDGVDTVMGDVTAYDSMESAFEGQDAVVFLVALSPLFKPKGGNDRHFEVHTEGTRNAVQAAEAHDVDRFVQMSALGADPNGPTAYLRAKGQAEDVVRDSDLDWVIIRPSVVFGDDAEFLSFTKKVTPPGLAPLPGGGKQSRFQPIWIGDFVPMLVETVEDDDHVGEIYELGGPEVLTLKEVAKRLRGSVIIPVPMPIAGAGLKVMGSIPGFPMDGDQFRSLKIDNTPAENDVTAFGRDPSSLKTLDEYLEIAS